MTRPAADVGGLCLECGLCCDGTLHTFTELQPNELEAARNAGFAVGATPGGDRSFRQPCPMYRNNACAVYERGRPAACSAYFCKLAVGVTEGRIGRDRASGIVAQAKRLRATIAMLGLPDETFDAARARWLDEARSGAAAREPAWSIAMLAFQRFLDRHFRKQDGEATMAAAKD